jgi:hypothetical protein
MNNFQRDYFCEKLEYERGGRLNVKIDIFHEKSHELSE